MSKAVPLHSPEGQALIARWRGSGSRRASDPPQTTPSVSKSTEGDPETSPTVCLTVCPVGKPRQTQRDRWAKRPAVLRYRAFCDAVRAQWPADLALPLAFHVVFRLPIPKSRRTGVDALTEGQPHDQKPDVDNMVKALLDALCAEDKAVWHVDAVKLWTLGDGSITIQPITNA